MKRWLLAVAMVTLALITAACGGSQEATPSEISPTPSATSTSEPTPTPTVPPIDIDTVLSLTGETMAGLSSFHVRLDHEAGSIQLIPGLNIAEAEVDVVSPDRLSASFRGGFGGFAVRATLIVIGEDSFLTNPLTGEWEQIQTDVSPLGFFSPSRGISTIVSEVHSVEVSSEAVGTVLTLSGELPAKALESLLGPSEEGASVKVEMVIDTQGHFLTSARIEGKVVPSDVEDAVRILSLSKFNETIVVEPPE